MLSVDELLAASTALVFQASTSELAGRVTPENKIASEQLAPRIAFLGRRGVVGDGAFVGSIGAGARDRRSGRRPRQRVPRCLRNIAVTPSYDYVHGIRVGSANA